MNLEPALLDLVDTDAGLIPTEWRARQVRDVCTLINGRGFKPHEWSDSGLPIIRIQNLNGSDIFNYFQGSFDPKIAVENGQLLFAWSGSRGTSFGPHIWRGSSAVLNYHTWKVVPNGSIDSDFFFRALAWLTTFIENNAHGASALVHTQKWEMEGYYLAVPPLGEQRRIAEALRDTDALIGSLERLIAKKLSIKQGMMQHILTGKTRLPGFNGEWQSKKLSELLAYEQPGRYLVSSTDYVRTGIPVLTAGKTFVLGHTTETDGVYEALPVVIFDDFTTASKYVSFPFKAKSSAMKMLSAKGGTNLRFVFERMQQIDFVAVDHKRRWIAEFSKLEIAMPAIEEQHAIAAVIEDTHDEIDALERRLYSIRAIKQGMMQELLTGRTRLIPAEVAA